MDTLNIDKILNRENSIKILKDTLNNFEKNIGS